MVFELKEEDRQTPFVATYCPRSSKQDELCRQAVKTYAAKWFTIKSSNAYVRDSKIAAFFLEITNSEFD